MLASSRYDITMGCVMVMMMRMTITQHQWLWFIGFRTALSSFVVLVLYSQKDRGERVCMLLVLSFFYNRINIPADLYQIYLSICSICCQSGRDWKDDDDEEKNESCLTPIWKTYMFCRHMRQRTSKEMICVQKIFLVYWLDIHNTTCM